MTTLRQEWGVLKEINVSAGVSNSRVLWPGSSSVTAGWMSFPTSTLRR